MRKNLVHGTVVVLIACAACSSTSKTSSNTPVPTATPTANATATSAPKSTSAPTSTPAPTAHAVPTLGRPWSPNQKGYGEVRPATIDNNGDPTGRVTNITWNSWGGTQAIGQGTSTYVAPGSSVAQGQQETATVTAFDEGTCGGRFMYRAVEWYFPQHGQHFSSTNYIDICSGKYVGTH